MRVVLVALEELAAPVGQLDHRGVREAVLKDPADPPATLVHQAWPGLPAKRERFA